MPTWILSQYVTNAISIVAVGCIVCVCIGNVATGPGLLWGNAITVFANVVGCMEPVARAWALGVRMGLGERWEG